MLDRINEDIKTAMKTKDKPRLEAVRMLKSSLLENKTSKKPRPEDDVAIAHVKKIKDSIQSYPKDSPEIQKLTKEIGFLVSYVPQPMAKGDVESLISAFLNDNKGANFGMVMKEISPKIKGRFDGREASQIVKTLMEN
jgi:uncharacterized protein YqeY